MKPLITFIFIAILAGCSRSDLLERMAPDDRKWQAIETLEALRKGTGDETFALLVEELKNDQAKRTLAMLAQGMPDGDYTDLTFVDYEWRMSNGESYYYFVFEYNFDGRYILADITLQKNEDGFLIAGLNLNEIAESIVVSNKFSFADAGVLHYGFLMAVIILPVFSIWTLIICIRTNGLKRKWLWCLFILIGFMSFNLNWNSGEWEWQVISFQLLSGSVFSTGAHGPWMLGFSVPVGAIAFWGRRSKLKAQSVVAQNDK